MNIDSGNGDVQVPLHGTFGIGIVGDSSGNLVERNIIAGNTNGVLIKGPASGSPSGNVVRLNNISGNPAAQISATFGSTVGADIQDFSSADMVTFQDNLCLTYSGATTPAPCPNIPALFLLLYKRGFGP